MRYEASKKLYSYWNNLRSQRKAPERSEIEPSDIREYLGDTFILEVNKTLHSISFRLAGTRLCGVYGRELKGFGFLGLWSEEDNLRVLRAVSRVYRDYKPAMISHSGTTENGHEVIFETLILPLLPTHDGDIRMLGISTTKENPYWLGSDPILNNRVISTHNMPVEGEAGERVPTLVPFPSDLEIEPNNNFATDAGRPFGHLRIIEGGKQS